VLRKTKKEKVPDGPLSFGCAGGIGRPSLSKILYNAKHGPYTTAKSIKDKEWQAFMFELRECNQIDVSVSRRLQMVEDILEHHRDLREDAKLDAFTFWYNATFTVDDLRAYARREAVKLTPYQPVHLSEVLGSLHAAFKRRDIYKAPRKREEKGLKTVIRETLRREKEGSKIPLDAKHLSGLSRKGRRAAHQILHKENRRVKHQNQIRDDTTLRRRLQAVVNRHAVDPLLLPEDIARVCTSWNVFPPDLQEHKENQWHFLRKSRFSTRTRVGSGPAQATHL
jgi:hypothetical protein